METARFNGVLLSGVVIVYSIIGLLRALFGRNKGGFTGTSGSRAWKTNVPYTRLVAEIIRYTGFFLAEKRIRMFPPFKLYYKRHKKYARQFDGQVIIYLKSNPDIPALVNTVLHEVMHYVQQKTDKQIKRYGEFTDTFGYHNNPFEKESRSFAEKYEESCLKYLESKQLIRRV
jgi:hypothetical protein